MRPIPPELMRQRSTESRLIGCCCRVSARVAGTNRPPSAILVPSYITEQKAAPPTTYICNLIIMYHHEPLAEIDDGSSLSHEGVIVVRGSSEVFTCFPRSIHQRRFHPVEVQERKDDGISRHSTRGRSSHALISFLLPLLCSVKPHPMLHAIEASKKAMMREQG